MKKLFSLFALAGAFVACQPEELETAFSVDPATVTIDVTVTDVQTGAAAEDVTVTCSDGAAKVEGNVITLTGNPAIDETTVTVTAIPAPSMLSQSARKSRSTGFSEAELPTIMSCLSSESP